MGEQFIDLFAAGAYALVGRVYAALAQPAFAWIFYLLATTGMLFALFESALEQRPDFWLRHLAAVCLSAVLTISPQRVDLAQLAYAAPGRIEQSLGTRVGAAPHLTYWIERLGAHAAVALERLTQSQPALAVPGVAAQVDQIASDPGLLRDTQVRANLEIWRRRIVPQILSDHPDLAQQIRAAGLLPALLNPAPASAEFVGAAAADRARAVRSLLAHAAIDLHGVVQAQGPLLNQITQDAGARDWSAGEDKQATLIAFAQRSARPVPGRGFSASPAYDDALRQADAVAGALRAELPAPGDPLPVRSVDQLHEMLGRSVLYSAGVALAGEATARAAVGSLCQRSGGAACRAAFAPVVEASAMLRVPAADRYNTTGWTTLLQQPLTTTLLTITSLLLGLLSTLVVSVLPFALGVAKTIAILISVAGTWLLLWPGRGRIALSWMVGPIGFVSLWSVLFNLWADMEPALNAIADTVSASDHASWAARRAMSIAIALGYMGLPSLAIGIIYGESGRALYHASARLETAILMAWHTRASIIAFGRRWLVNSPLARRWNQRAYRAIGLGPLARGRAGAHPPTGRTPAPKAPRRISTTGARTKAAPAQARAGHDNSAGSDTPKKSTRKRARSDSEEPP